MESGKMERSYYEVLGLCCATEVPLVEKLLRQLEGVDQVSVILPTKTVIVVHEPSSVSRSEIANVLNKARMEASLRPAPGEINSAANKWPSPYTIACGVLFGLSFLKYVYHPLKWLALAAVIVGVPPIMLRSLASIKNFTLNIHVLVLISVVGTVALQDYWEAASIVFLFSIAQWLETRASYKAMDSMSSLASLAPPKAVIAATGEVLNVNDIEVNAVIAVKAGEIIPIDGNVVEGQCEVDEKTLTGESFPVVKEIGSTVWAGSMNLNGYISVRTTSLAKDSVVARMANIVEEAHQSKSQAQGLIDKCAKYYIPAVAIISACIALIPVVLRLKDEDHWFHLAIVVLVGSCPCALILSTPVTFFCALSRAAKDGLLFKHGHSVEVLANVKNVAFDKTGTITKGELTVTNFQSICNDIDVHEMLTWVSSIESRSSHPTSAALIHYAESRSIEPKPEYVEDFQNFPGEGVSGKIEGKSIFIGNQRLGLRAGCKIAGADGMQVKSDGYVYTKGKPVGIFSLTDSCRTGALQAIEDIKSLGITTIMLTGDNHAAAMTAQHQLNGGLDLVYAELLPDDKAKIIADLQKSGVTAMVGDGINDAAAMVTADISISMGIAGSALAVESSKIILISNDLRKIAEAIRLARKAFHKLITNVIISISLKIAILGLAFAGYPLIWAAVLTDVGACFIVILNSMQLLQETPKHESGRSNSRYGTFSLGLHKGKRTGLITDGNSQNRGYKRLDADKCSDNCCYTTNCKVSDENGTKSDHEKIDTCNDCLGCCTTNCKVSDENGTKSDHEKIDTCNDCLGCCEEGRSAEPGSPNLSQVLVQ